MVLLSEVLQACTSYKDLLEVREEGDYIIIHPKAYINDKEVYSKIGKTLHSFNAEYVKAGKLTHWRILRGEGKPALGVNHVQKAQQLMLQALEELKQAGY